MDLPRSVGREDFGVRFDEMVGDICRALVDLVGEGLEDIEESDDFRTGFGEGSRELSELKDFGFDREFF